MVAITRLSTFQYGQWGLERGDFANPGAVTIEEKVRILYASIFRNTEVQEILKDVEGEFSYQFLQDGTLEIDLGLLKRKRTCTPALTPEQQTLAQEIDQLAKKAGIGQVLQAPPKWVEGQKLSYIQHHFWSYFFKGLIIGGETADALSLIRNTGFSLNPKWPLYPLFVEIGGFVNMAFGLGLAIKAIYLMVQAYAKGDTEGLRLHLALLGVGLAYAAIGLSMVIAAELLFSVAGTIFYTVFGLMSLWQAGKDVWFRYQMNQQYKTNTPEDIAKTLQWLQTQAQDKEAFLRCTSADAARRVENEITNDLIQRVQKGDASAIAQARFVLEEVSKANFINIFIKDLGFLLITVLGLVSVWSPIVRLCAVLFASGSLLWLISNDMKIPIDLKQTVGDKLWDFHKKQGFGQSWTKTTCQSPPSAPPSPNSSTISAPSEDSLATA